MAARQQGLTATVRDAVAQMTWLQPSDRALVEVALTYARAIEDAQGGPDAAKMTGWMGPHLVNALRALGGAPAERKSLGVEDQVRGKLAQLRAARSA